MSFPQCNMICSFLERVSSFFVENIEFSIYLCGVNLKIFSISKFRENYKFS